MIRKDLYKVDIQDNFYFVVFHKKVKKGFGSAVSLYVNDYEFLKFDCIGEKRGHYHIYGDNMNVEILFNEKTCEEQINRTCALITDINVF